MNALLVHGMGRTSLSWVPSRIRFRAKEINTTTFSYCVSAQDFSSIVNRLVGSITKLSEAGAYVVVGHSLGGVLLRAAIEALPSGTRLPTKLFLVGSPVYPSRIATRLQHNLLYRAFTRDCGQLLASAKRMASIPIPAIPAIAIIGTRGIHGRFSPFVQESNDGIVAVSEASAPWLAEEIHVPVVHTLLPSSKLVAELIMKKLV